MSIVSTVKAVAQQGVKTAAAVGDLVRRPEPGVTVLIYHRVGGVGGGVDLSPARFEEQMAELVAGDRLRRLDDVLGPLTGDAEPDAIDPDGSVVVTFDDGTADFVDHALPIIEKHRVPTLLYLATRFVDEAIDFPGGGPAISWTALREARDTGLVEIGSHTHSHKLLDRLPDEDVADELDRCDGLIEERLQRPVHHFAYPKAVLGSPAARRAVAARYRSAAVAGTRPNVPGGTDPQRLARSPIQVADGMVWFRRKAAGGMAFEDRLRGRRNRRRYADLTS